MDAILYGNGFNLLSKDCPSWQELLTNISDREKSPILNGIPPPHYNMNRFTWLLIHPFHHYPKAKMRLN